MNKNEQPNYTDILYLVQMEDPDMPLDKMTELWEQYEYLNSRREELTRLFNTRYMFREISTETLKRWFLLVKKKFLETARFYNHAFKVLEENIDKMDELGKETVKETLWGSGIRDKFQDTPVTPIVTEEYASSINDRLRTGKDTETTKTITETYIKGINDLINTYNDVCLRWVNEFEPCFMSTLMRV